MRVDIDQQKEIIWCAINPIGLIYYLVLDRKIDTIRGLIREFKKLEKRLGGLRTCNNLEDFKDDIKTMIEFEYLKVDHGRITSIHIPSHPIDREIINKTRELLKEVYAKIEGDENGRQQGKG